MNALHGCRTVSFDSCNNLSLPTVLVVIVRFENLNIKRNYYYIFRLWDLSEHITSWSLLGREHRPTRRAKYFILSSLYEHEMTVS